MGKIKRQLKLDVTHKLIFRWSKNMLREWIKCQVIQYHINILQIEDGLNENH